MKTNIAKKSAPVDSQTIREDEIDELNDAVEEQSAVDDTTALTKRISDLEQELQAANDARLRALADYQNLVRRSQADRLTWSKIATQGFVESILEPLEHLQMATTQLNDSGLTMVVKQLFVRLSEQGLERLDVIGKTFNPETMEAIAGSHPEGKKVVSVFQNGYTLNGVLIQPAKVKVG